ncbi:MAG: DUF202 domain-containing protein [candidate division Zixibacteria bacterium]|nr:DUF202 domain-containing protein [candidate division Zixibacteria bacterium]
MSDEERAVRTEKDLPLLDNLAANRTILANERTYLSYMRTALTMFIAGLTFIKFFEGGLVKTIGWIFLPVAAATIIVGFIRYKRMKCKILALEGIDIRCSTVGEKIMSLFR